MRRKAVAIMALLGFATSALLDSLKGADFAASVPRAIAAAVAMGVVGFVAGVIAEKAVAEAVNTKLPVYTPDVDENDKTTEVSDQEEDK